jgi:phosphate transport system substrate-binding protein
MPLPKRSLHLIILITLAVVAVALAACNPSGPNSAGSASATIALQGAGATFPNPLYQKWLSEYGKLNPNIRIDYQSIGSGGGIKQIQSQVVQFGASDSPMKDADLQAAPGEILHVPTVLGAVVITYNLSTISQPLNFSPDVIADIFIGKITKWNDPRISGDNKSVSLPAADITVVHRSDGSGTSAVFTDYLSKISPEWKDKVGSGTSPSWPIGIGGKGNEGVTGQIKNTPNTIGYVELAYAVQNKLPVAKVKNASGSFIDPSIDAVTAAAAASAANTPDDLRVSITNAQGADVYPISSYTYILVYKDQKDAVKGKALVDFLWWGIHDGEKYARELQYAPLPADIVKRAEGKINSIVSQGKALR